jgi:hypothetical protein
MRHLRIAVAFSLALFAAATIATAQGKPASVPVGPPSTPVAPPSVPPAEPPSSLTDYVCGLLPVPYLCD